MAFEEARYLQQDHSLMSFAHGSRWAAFFILNMNREPVLATMAAPAPFLPHPQFGRRLRS